VLFFQTAFGVAHPRRARRRNRTRLFGAALFEPALGIGQPPRATLARAERLGQLIAAPITQALVLLGVDRIGVGQHLARELLVIARRALRRVRMNLRAVDGEHRRVDQTGVRTQGEDVTEEVGEGVLMTLAESRDGRVVGNLVRGEDAEGDVFLARALDRTRRPDPTRVRIEQQRDHHRRLKRRAAVPVLSIRAVERLQVHLRDRVDHEPREVPLGKPISDVWRQQKRLLTIGGEKVLAHLGIVLIAPDRPFAQQRPWRPAATREE
jgi:hypothetical protein